MKSKYNSKKKLKDIKKINANRCSYLNHVRYLHKKPKIVFCLDADTQFTSNYMIRQGIEPNKIYCCQYDLKMYNKMIKNNIGTNINYGDAFDNLQKHDARTKFDNVFYDGMSTYRKSVDTISLFFSRRLLKKQSSFSFTVSSRTETTDHQYRINNTINIANQNNYKLKYINRMRTGIGINTYYFICQ